jgi:hypothetical protein
VQTQTSLFPEVFSTNLSKFSYFKLVAHFHILYITVRERNNLKVGPENDVKESRKKSKDKIPDPRFGFATWGGTANCFTAAELFLQNNPANLAVKRKRSPGWPKQTIFLKSKMPCKKS